MRGVSIARVNSITFIPNRWQSFCATTNESNEVSYYNSPSATVCAIYIFKKYSTVFRLSSTRKIFSSKNEIHSSAVKKFYVARLWGMFSVIYIWANWASMTTYTIYIKRASTMHLAFPLNYTLQIFF